MADVRTAVVLDFQNMHLSGAELFRTTPRKPLHDSLLDPTRFANQLLSARNKTIKPGGDRAVLHRVEVFRGLPSNDHDPERYNRSQMQRANWQRDPRVNVTLRPVRMERIAAVGSNQFRGFEKGVDVLCALALIRLAAAPNIDLVILASHDSDLKAALDDAIDLGKARIETCAWFHPRLGISYRRLRPHAPRSVRHTLLDVDDFTAAHDPTDYH
jgi:uncharacterized LabA/DUF88 family protein